MGSEPGPTWLGVPSSTRARHQPRVPRPTVPVWLLPFTSPSEKRGYLFYFVKMLWAEIVLAFFLKIVYAEYGKVNGVADI